jgi:pyruvate/2-oxoglutarate dehydrogenase complex dihydrolipoamide dehydrogenase (E3) component
MSKFDYNIIIIGGGSAGLVSAYIGSTIKAKVAFIESHKMGGAIVLIPDVSPAKL